MRFNRILFENGSLRVFSTSKYQGIPKRHLPSGHATRSKDEVPEVRQGTPVYVGGQIDVMRMLAINLHEVPQVSSPVALTLYQQLVLSVCDPHFLRHTKIGHCQ